MLELHRRNARQRRHRSDQSLPVYGLFVEGPSTLLVDNVRVANCNAGGVVIEGDGFDDEFLTNFTIVDSLIENNTGGPGNSNSNAQLTVTNSIIRGNINTGGNGGGILNFGANGSGVALTEVTDSTIENNTASRGGGIYTGNNAADTQANVNRSLIRNNVANDSGGGYYSDGQFEIQGSTFTENWANNNGGAIFHARAEAKVFECTISGNGGTRNGITTLLGGGVYADGGATQFRKTIIANNIASFSPDIFSPNALGSSYNLVENATGAPNFGGTDLIGQDPLLGRLQSLGGPTRVLPLLAGSPAIDRVPGSQTLESNVDQRGSPRFAPPPVTSTTPRDGDNGSGILVGFDIGAFEQGAFESEFLTVAAKTSTVTHSLIANSNYMKGEGTRLHATLDTHYVTYAIPVLSTGTYSFLIRVRKGNNRGIYQIATSNSSGSGFTNRGMPQDLYNLSEQFADPHAPRHYGDLLHDGNEVHPLHRHRETRPILESKSLSRHDPARETVTAR